MSILNDIVDCGDAIVGFFAEQLDSCLKRVFQIVGSSLCRFVFFLHLIHSEITRNHAYFGLNSSTKSTLPYCRIQVVE